MFLPRPLSLTHTSFSVFFPERHERCAASDLRCHGDVEGDRHRPRRRGLAAAVVDDPEHRRPGRRPGDLPVARLHSDFPRRGLPGVLRPVQVCLLLLPSSRASIFCRLVFTCIV